MRAWPLRIVVGLSLASLGGCAGVQSVLAPSGEEASRIDMLFWFATIFLSAVFVGVVIAASVAIFGPSRWRERLAREGLVIGAGIVFPIVSLTLLLGYSVAVMGMGGQAEASPDRLRIAVSGERWWWRVTYLLPDGRRIASANELRLPVGQPVELELTSPDVIHSLWVPKLAGKLDMVPGRVNILTLNAREAGLSRGQCAEYCGGPHALMSFFVVAMPPEEFSAWLEREAADAAVPAAQAGVQGQALFLATGCGGCHAVRGTTAAGTIGPDLTHVGSRHSLAAAALPNEPWAFARWIRDGQHIKPENLMPPYGIFSDAELGQLAAYLDSLE